MSYCYLKQNCGEGQFQSYQGCTDCSMTLGTQSTVDECSKCDTTPTPRIMFGFSCYPKKECGEGQFQGNNQCFDCSASYVPTSNADECAKCDTTATPREMRDNYCRLKNCGENQFRSADS